MHEADEPWWRGATLYQIYPRSFADSNDDGVGDLRGILRHLDNVASLGVDGIWISPFFRSPMRDFGYDVSDACAVDPLFGTLADFDALLGEAHARGLKVLIDQVWSHTALEHPWFLESRRDRENPKADWYVWAEARPDGSPPNNWQSWMGGPAWTWEPRRGQYYLHNFLREMPDLNFHCEEVQEAILGIADFWLRRGVDGFRLDTANFYFHDRSLRDNPPLPPSKRGTSPVLMQRHVHNVCQPGNLVFIERIRKLLDSHGGRMAVAEIGSADNHGRMVEYTSGEKRLHTAYSFLLLGERQGPAQIARHMEAWQKGVATSAWPAWAFSNHDAPRVASRWAAPEATPELWLTLLLCLRGTLFLYQGEELGLPQAELSLEQIQDPFGKANWPLNKGRDGCRTPMPWTSEGPAAGFSTVTPWLPVPAEHARLCVENQEAQPASCLQLTRRLLALRRAHPALRLGSFRALETEGGLLVFERSQAEDRLLVAVNLGAQEREVRLPAGTALDEVVFQLQGSRVNGNRVSLCAGSAVIGKLKLHEQLLDCHRAYPQKSLKILQ